MRFINLFSPLAICIFAMLVSCSDSAADAKESDESQSQGTVIPQGQSGLNLEEDWMANRENCYIRNGKFYQDGRWRFLKVAKPLSNFATAQGCEAIAANISKYKELNYDCIELNCYWFMFETDGDGTIDVDLAPLRSLINQIYEAGMFPCLTVETYAVGGGQMPSGFWDLYPDAAAVDEYGKYIRDDEYGFGTAVVSICHEGYRSAARRYITNLVNGLGAEAMKKVLWFETTVEPQFMSAHNICYSKAALEGYNKWRAENGVTTDEMPVKSDGTPYYGSSALKSFVKNVTWNKYRAQVIAEWISGDAKAFKDAYEALTGQTAYVAADYLDASDSDMRARLGNAEEMLSHLENVDIIQINWTYNFVTGTFNQKAYTKVHKVMKARNLDWAITEHMTFNGSDYSSFSRSYTLKHLTSVIANNTRFGFEFVNANNGHQADSFQIYNSDWSAAVPLCYVEDSWREYLDMIWNTQLTEVSK